jgi:class 3 adenylate cyclase
VVLSPTRYARGPGGSVAYRTYGDGEETLLFTTWWGRSVDGLDDHPGATRMFRFLEPLGRCVLLDPRGVGVSDPLPPGTQRGRDAWADDLLTVLDDLGVERALVSAEALAGHGALAMAVRAPERVIRLHLANVDDRTGLTDDEVETEADRFARAWGTGALGLAIGDHGADREAAARAERLACSPAEAHAWARAELSADVTDLAGAVSVPVLVTTIGDSGWHRAERARALADAIPGATFLLLDGPRRYAGDPDSDALAHWLAGRDPGSDQRDLVTVLFTDVVASTAHAAERGDHRWRQELDALDALVANQVQRFGGRVVKQTGDGHLAEFASPSDAVRCARRIVATVDEVGVRVRVGVHVGEVERRADGDLGGLTVHIAARVAALGDGGEALVSRTVADLVAGSAFELVDRGEHELKGVPGTWQVLAVEGRSTVR